MTGEHLIAVSQVFGTVQRLDRGSFAVQGTWDGFDSRGDAIEAPNGNIVVAETSTGRLIKITGPAPADREVLAQDLAAPTGLALAADGAVYVAETGGGRVVRVDAVSGDKTVLASGLEQPEGLTVAPDGAIVVVEVGAKRLTRMDAGGRSTTVLAGDPPVGLSNGL